MALRSHYHLTSLDYHVEQFSRLSNQLKYYTHRCYFSFVNFYSKTERNLKQVSQTHNIVFQHPDLDEKRQLAQQLSQIAASRGITLYSCCDNALVGCGIQQSRCIDIDIIRKLRPEIEPAVKAAPTRQDCGCVESVDIGAYHTCGFGCTYCYATISRTAALRRLNNCNPEDTVLWRPNTLQGVDLRTKEYQPKRKHSPKDC